MATRGKLISASCKRHDKRYLRVKVYGVKRCPHVRKVFTSKRRQP